MTKMDENGEILLLHASHNNARLFVLPFYMTLVAIWQLHFLYIFLGIEMVVFNGYFGLSCAISAWVRDYGPKGRSFSPNPS